MDGSSMLGREDGRLVLMNINEPYPTASELNESAKGEWVDARG